jgi:hypothetical protein
MSVFTDTTRVLVARSILHDIIQIFVHSHKKTEHICRYNLQYAQHVPIKTAPRIAKRPPVFGLFSTALPWTAARGHATPWIRPLFVMRCCCSVAVRQKITQTKGKCLCAVGNVGISGERQQSFCSIVQQTWPPPRPDIARTGLTRCLGFHSVIHALYPNTGVLKM